MSGKNSGAWKKVRSWLGQPAQPQPAQTAESLQVESLEPRLAMAVAPIPLLFGGTTGIDIFDARAGAELVTQWADNRDYRAPSSPTSPVEVTSTPGGFSINDMTVNENDGTVTFTVTRTTNPNRAASVDFATADGSAVAGTAIPGDYVAQSGTLNFAIGQTTASVTINLIDYDADEADENFSVVLSNAQELTGPLTPASLRILDGTGVATILDTDTAPDFTIGDVTVNESQATVTFTITRGTNTRGTVSVDYATVDGTATAGADYQPATGTLTFNDTVTTQTVTINLSDDNIYEGNESFRLRLSNAQNLDGGSVTISDTDGVATIVENDPVPTITVSSPSVNENAGTLTYTITLSNPAAFAINYDYALVDGTATTAGLDYTGSSGSRTIAALATTDTIVVPINDDILVEGLENFSLQLTNIVLQSTPTQAIANATGTGGIVDNDSRIDIAAATVAENGGALVFTLTRTGGTNITTTVNYTVTGISATAGTDFTAPAPGAQVIFAPGQTTATISVPILNDTRYENDETLQVTLTSATNSTHGTGSIGVGTAIGTITNDDPPPNITINDIRQSEGSGSFTFTVSLSALSDLPVTFDFATANGTATAGTDYTTASGIGRTIAAGSLSTTITVSIIDDTTDVEITDDTFLINLTNIVGATLVGGSGLGSIVDNDARISIVNSSSANETAGTMTFAVARVAHPDVATTATYNVQQAATGTGFAAAADDFIPVSSSTLTFIPGDATENIVVTILDDTFYEGDETFLANLVSGSNTGGGTVIISNSTSLGTIIENEARPSIAINNVTSTENVAAGVYVFTVTMTGSAATAVTVDYTTANVTATGSPLAATNDYQTTTGTLTFAAFQPSGQTRTISVPINNDTLPEQNETFQVILSNLQNAFGLVDLSATPGVGTINNNDHNVTISGPQFVNEGNSGTQTVTFTLTRSGAAVEAVELHIRTRDDSAVDGGASASGGNDYNGTNNIFNSRTFAANSSTMTFTVDVNGDTTYEGIVGAVERLFIDFQNGFLNTGTITTGTSGELFIIHDDNLPTVTIGNVAMFEREGFAVFPVTISNTSAFAVSADWVTVNGTAVAVFDYQPLTGTFNIPAGSTQTTISVPVANDFNNEGNEVFSVLGIVPSLANASWADSQGDATIRNDDFALQLLGPSYTRPGQTGTFFYDLFTVNHVGGPVDIETHLTGGVADTVLYIYGPVFDPADPTNPNFLFQDDDSGAGLASRIQTNLGAGIYQVVVTSFGPLALGTYEITFN